MFLISVVGRRAVARLVGVALSGAMLVACSASRPASQEVFVGPEGGALALAGTAAVVIPSGALAEGMKVRMSVERPPVEPPESSVGEVVAFTPHGTSFEQAASVAMTYELPAGSDGELHVMRLADDQSTEWEMVGGAHFENGKVDFQTTRFSYYTVTTGPTCTPSSTGIPDTRCATACPATHFCTSAGTCAPLLQASLCENANIKVINGQIPSTIKVVSTEQTRDTALANQLATAFQSRCGVTPAVLSQATAGLLDPCNDAPLVGSGNTLIVTGGAFSQRIVDWLDGSTTGPVKLVGSGGGATASFVSRAGTVLASFPQSTLTASHDYFAISVSKDPKRGGLVVNLFGAGWEGTGAAVWYFLNKVQPTIVAKTRDWTNYIVVEWTDDGDKLKGATDTYRVVAKDVP